MLPVLLWACSGPTSPDRPASAPAAIVSIDTIPALGGHEVKVPIRLSYDAASPVTIDDLGVIDLLLTYDDSLLFFIQAERGDAIEEWEYFTYRGYHFGQPESERKNVQVILRRDLADGKSPDPPQLRPNGVVVWLTFFVSNDYYPEGTSAGIDFWLRECGNNILQSDDDTSCVYLPDLAAGNPIVESGYDDEDCSDWGAIRAGVVERTLKLQGGVVKLVESLPPVYGDLDLDGAGFEESDLALYRAYFLHGFVVWNPTTITRQIAQSDMNRDGEPLTLADYEYLRTRMAEGEDLDTVQIHPYSSAATLFPDSSTAGVLVLPGFWPEPLTALWLQLEGLGDGAPAPTWDGPQEPEIEYVQRDDVMRILIIFPHAVGSGFPLSRLRVYSGNQTIPRLVTFQASKYPGEPMTAQTGRWIGPG